MKLLVAVKRVVDYTARIRIKPDKSGLDIENLRMSMNPFCEIAVEEAVRMKEAGLADEIFAVTVGAKQHEPVLRSALALGADRVGHVVVDGDIQVQVAKGPKVKVVSDLVTPGDGVSETAGVLRNDTKNLHASPLGVARCLARIAHNEGSGLVLLGKQAIDSDCGQTVPRDADRSGGFSATVVRNTTLAHAGGKGQMLAALLGWPQATFASKVVIDEAKQSAVVTREVEAGLLTVKVPLPAVITADLRLNTPRYAPFKKVMEAKRKPITTWSAAELGADCSPQLEQLKVEEPPKRQGGVVVASVDELLDKLRHEANVLD